MSDTTLKTRDHMQAEVILFREKFGLPNSATPRALTPEEAALHIKLVREEFEEELVPALESGDIVEIYDAGIDVIYYLLGMLANAGMDIAPGFDEVQGSNMSKLDPVTKTAILSRGPEIDGAPLGKVLKGPDYYAPDLRAVLIEQGADL